MEFKLNKGGLWNNISACSYFSGKTQLSCGEGADEQASRTMSGQVNI